MKNFVFISPNFPTNYWKFCHHLKANGINVLGIGDQAYDELLPELRSALGLRSACFTWEVQGDHLVFFVTGYGHGVGLSQYGANRMAESGAPWPEILTHY